MSGLTIDWIIERLKVSGEGTKQEVLKALENASNNDLMELATDCYCKVLIPVISAVLDTIKNLDADTIKEILHKEETNGKAS